MAGMSRSRPFRQVDVFGATAFGGNPVAVVLDGDGLDDAGMQRIARWTNLSETTFVLPPTTGDADYRVRIFTPGGELPFAGHPTLGTAHAWLEHGGRPRDAGAVVQECVAGLIEVRRDGQRLAFAAPPTRRSGPIDEPELASLVSALGIDPDQVIGHQWVDNGPGWSALRLADAQQVLDLAPDFSSLPDVMLGVLGTHPPGSEQARAGHAYELRAFAPRIGVAEDPVTGSLHASVAQWLVSSGLAPGRVWTATQGTRLGRSGVVAIEVDETGAVWVGGATTTVIAGTIEA